MDISWLRRFEVRLDKRRPLLLGYMDCGLIEYAHLEG
jgi:hypothetical protein